MARDPAQGVINWFAALMVCVAIASLAGLGLLVWGGIALLQHLFGG